MTKVTLYYSTTLHCWEAWSSSRVAVGGLDHLMLLFPAAEGPSLQQCKVADADRILNKVAS